MAKKKLIGKIVSSKMQKTVVVEVERMKFHSKFKVRHKMHKRYKVHNEDPEYKVGDRVIIEESLPISKEKRWRIINKV